MSLVTSNRYKLKVYDMDGNFVQTFNDATFAPFKKALNSSLGTMDLNVAAPYDEISTAIILGRDFQVFMQVGDGEKKIYSGYVEGISRTRTATDTGITLHLVPHAARLSNTYLIGAGDIFSITRDGTYSADVGSLDSGKASDQFKFITNNFQSRNGLIDQEYLTGYDTDINFGGVNRVTQSFTPVQSVLNFVTVRLKYNSGTAASLVVSIRANDGSNKPTGSALAIARVPAGAIIDTGYKNYKIYFDTPLAVTPGTKLHIDLYSSGAGTGTYAWAGDLSSATYTGGDRTYSGDGGSTWTVYSGTDMLFQTGYVSSERSRISYSTTSIDDSSDDYDWSFTSIKDMTAMDYVLRYGRADWNYYIDENNVVHYHPSGFSKAKVLDSCDSASGWTSGSDVASIAAYTQLSTTATVNNLPGRKEGTASVSFALGGTSTSHIIYKDITAADLSAYRNAGCWLLIPKDTNLSDVRIRLYSNTHANYSEWAINPAVLKKGDWNWITYECVFDRTPTATSGTLDKTVVDRIALVINTIASTETTTWIMDDWKAGNLEVFNAVFGKNMQKFDYYTGIEGLINNFIMSNNLASGTLLKSYKDQNSINKYMLSESNRIDSRITVEAKMDQVGGDTIARNSYPTKTASFTVRNDDSSFPVFDIKPGYIVKILNLGDAFDLQNTYFVVSGISHKANESQFTIVEFGKPFGDRVSKLEQDLDKLQGDAGSIGDTPNIAIIDE